MKMMTKVFATLPPKGSVTQTLTSVVPSIDTPFSRIKVLPTIVAFTTRGFVTFKAYDSEALSR